MSIEEKLSTVAENTPKVYNQGYEDSKNSVIPLERYARTIAFISMDMFDTPNVVLNLDSAGDNLPAVETCMLIMPKDTPVMHGKRMCYFIGLTGDFSIMNMNVVKGKHFNVNDGVSIYCTPPTANLSVFKIAF